MEEKDSLAVITEKISGRRPRAHRRRPCPWTGSSPGPGICAASRRCMFQTPGLTLDVLLFLDSGAVRTFCKKYAGVDGERLTPLEERMLEGERPIPEASFSPRLINGLPVEPCASSSFTWVPFVRRERARRRRRRRARRLRFPVPAGRLLCVPPCARPLAPRDADR